MVPDAQLLSWSPGTGLRWQGMLWLVQYPWGLKDIGENNNPKDFGTGRLLLGTIDDLRKENDKLRTLITNLKQNQEDSFAVFKETLLQPEGRQLETGSGLNCNRISEKAESQPGDVSPPKSGPQGGGVGT